VRGTLEIFFGIFHSYPHFRKGRIAIQTLKNVPKFVDSALQKGQVRQKMTRPVNIPEKNI